MSQLPSILRSAVTSPSSSLSRLAHRGVSGKALLFEDACVNGVFVIEPLNGKLSHGTLHPSTTASKESKTLTASQESQLRPRFTAKPRSIRETATKPHTFTTHSTRPHSFHGRRTFRSHTIQPLSKRQVFSTSANSNLTRLRSLDLDLSDAPGNSKLSGDPTTFELEMQARQPSSMTVCEFLRYPRHPEADVVFANKEAHNHHHAHSLPNRWYHEYNGNPGWVSGGNYGSESVNREWSVEEVKECIDMVRYPEVIQGGFTSFAGLSLSNIRFNGLESNGRVSGPSHTEVMRYPEESYRSIFDLRESKRQEGGGFMGTSPPSHLSCVQENDQGFKESEEMFSTSRALRMMRYPELESPLPQSVMCMSAAQHTQLPHQSEISQEVKSQKEMLATSCGLSGHLEELDTLELNVEPRCWFMSNSNLFQHYPGGLRLNENYPLWDDISSLWDESVNKFGLMDFEKVFDYIVTSLDDELSADEFVSLHGLLIRNHSLALEYPQYFDGDLLKEEWLESVEKRIEEDRIAEEDPLLSQFVDVDGAKQPSCSDTATFSTPSHHQPQTLPHRSTSSIEHQSSHLTADWMRYPEKDENITKGVSTTLCLLTGWMRYPEKEQETHLIHHTQLTHPTHQNHQNQRQMNQQRMMNGQHEDEIQEKRGDEVSEVVMMRYPELEIEPLSQPPQPLSQAPPQPLSSCSSPLLSPRSAIAAWRAASSSRKSSQTHQESYRYPEVMNAITSIASSKPTNTPQADNHSPLYVTGWYRYPEDCGDCSSLNNSSPVGSSLFRLRGSSEPEEQKVMERVNEVGVKEKEMEAGVYWDYESSGALWSAASPSSAYDRVGGDAGDEGVGAGGDGGDGDVLDVVITRSYDWGEELNRDDCEVRSRRSNDMNAAQGVAVVMIGVCNVLPNALFHHFKGKGKGVRTGGEKEGVEKSDFGDGYHGHTDDEEGNDRKGRVVYHLSQMGGVGIAVGGLWVSPTRIDNRLQKQMIGDKDDKDEKEKRKDDHKSDHDEREKWNLSQTLRKGIIRPSPTKSTSSISSQLSLSPHSQLSHTPHSSELSHSPHSGGEGKVLPSNRRSWSWSSLLKSTASSPASTSPSTSSPSTSSPSTSAKDKNTGQRYDNKYKQHPSPLNTMKLNNTIIHHLTSSSLSWSSSLSTTWASSNTSPPVWSPLSTTITGVSEVNWDCVVGVPSKPTANHSNISPHSPPSSFSRLVCSNVGGGRWTGVTGGVTPSRGAMWWSPSAHSFDGVWGSYERSETETDSHVTTSEWCDLMQGSRRGEL